MFGKDESGQLALMDAMVFFIGCIAVSTVLFSSIEEKPISVDDRNDLEAGNVLAAFMRSSIGHDISIEARGSSVLLSETEAIADCLLLEGHLIAEGDAPSHFDVLNARLLDILGAICGPFVHPSLIILDVTSAASEILNAMPSDVSDGGVVYAASEGLSDSDGRHYSIQLRLVWSP